MKVIYIVTIKIPNGLDTYLNTFYFSTWEAAKKFVIREYKKARNCYIMEANNYSIDEIKKIFNDEGVIYDFCECEEAEIDRKGAYVSL